MTATTTTRPTRLRAAHTRPPRYRWVPISAAALVVVGLLWGAAMYYLASH